MKKRVISSILLVLVLATCAWSQVGFSPIGGSSVTGTPGSGDVTGPASSTDNAIPRFDGPGGKTLQNSGVTIDDSNNMTVPGAVTISTSLQAPMKPIDGHADHTLTADEVGGTAIHNSTQAAASTQTLPAVSNTKVYSFLALVETKVAQNWKFLRAGSDTICLDGTCSKTYFQFNNQNAGSMVQCVSSPVATTWYCKTILGTATTD